MDTSEKSPSFRPRTAKTAPLLPEIDIYLHLLVLIYLLDQQKLRFVSINVICHVTAFYQLLQNFSYNCTFFHQNNYLETATAHYTQVYYFAIS